MKILYIKLRRDTRIEIIEELERESYKKTDRKRFIEEAQPRSILNLYVLLIWK